MMASGTASTPGEDDSQLSALALANDPRWQLAQRIAVSKSFARSSFLVSFLLYVCDRELRGQASEITEHLIGIHAFGRPATYSPGEDNIVRSYARLLRKRLDEYFECEGKNERLRIIIPRGRYIPVFHTSKPEQTNLTASLPSSKPSLEALEEDSGAERDPDPVSAPRPIHRLRTLLAVGTAAILIFPTIWIGARLFGRAPESLSHRLWSQVFAPGRVTLIVPADSGFGILQNLTHHPVSLSDYVSGVYLSKIETIHGVDNRNLNDLSTQRYTSVVDLNIAANLSRLREFVPENSAIRYARDLRMEDLKHSNAILLGSRHTNPWVELFERDMNFALEYQAGVDDSIVLNRHPRAAESALYKNAWNDDSHRTYAVLAFVPSLDGAGHVFLVEGLNMAGTQAAGDFLLNDRAMAPVLQKARRSDGAFGSFELLLETSSIGANAPQAQVIAERYGSPASQ